MSSSSSDKKILRQSVTYMWGQFPFGRTEWVDNDSVFASMPATTFTFTPFQNAPWSPLGSSQVFDAYLGWTTLFNLALRQSHALFEYWRSAQAPAFGPFSPWFVWFSPRP